MENLTGTAGSLGKNREQLGEDARKRKNMKRERTERRAKGPNMLAAMVRQSVDTGGANVGRS